jgi:hypothetical protein
MDYEILKTILADIRPKHPTNDFPRSGDSLHTRWNRRSKSLGAHASSAFILEPGVLGPRKCAPNSAAALRYTGNPVDVGRQPT